jgi:ABC-type cobalamin/Fe3+-siderophores transport system ATPase subunit
MVNYLEGSIWRKWDLQVQTRLDKGYKCFGNNALTDDQLNQLAALTGLEKTAITSQEKSMSAEDYAKLFVAYVTTYTDISVVAVTDHNTGKELDALIAEAEKTEGKLTILPGVEVASNHGIHMLCIFNLTKRAHDTWKDTIEHFLTQIGVPANRFDQHSNPVNAQQSSQDILDVVEKAGGLCIFAHICTENGLFYKASPTANGGTAHADIYKHSLCNIVQIPSNGSISTGIENILSGGDPNYGKKKVTRIKCSDSRSLQDIGKSFSWIKADPTFEGLKQIIIEQSDRIALSDSKPDSKQPYHVIDSFSFKHSDFIPDTVPLNRNLVTIIGGKSTGKSLLLYHLAKTADPDEVKKRFKGVQKYGTLEAELDMTIKWYDGHTTTLGEQENRRKVTYIPQNYLNQLSDQDNKAVHEIVTELLLQQPGARKIKDTFSDSKRQHNENISQAVQRFFNILADIESVKNKLKELGDEQGISAYIQRLETEIQQAVKSAGFGDAEIKERQELEDKWEEICESYSVWNSDDGKLRQLWREQQTLVDFTRVNSLVGELSDIPQKHLIGEINVLKEHVAAKLTQAIQAQGKNLKESRKALYKMAKEVAKPLKQYRNKAKALTALKEKQELLKNIKAKYKAVIELTAKQKQLESDRNKTKSEVVRGYASLHGAYGDFCDGLKALHKTLEDVEIMVEPNFNGTGYQESFIETYIDKRADKGTMDIMDLQYNKQSPESHFKKAESIFDAILNASVKTKGQYGMDKIVGSLFSDRFTVSYLIKYQGDDFTSMSPGKRGLVLLKLLVDLDQNAHPILLDQPEDDLDNRSIYYDLVEFIRKRKRDRQIIVVTHNPNLVVGADAEQVVVANQQGEEGSENKKYKFEYVSGSIENSYLDKTEKAVLYQKGIREHICEILEGGEEAFKKRERKYSIPN